MMRFPVGFGTAHWPPCREMADLPEDLRRRVEAARGLIVDQPPAGNVVRLRPRQEECAA